MKTSLRPTRKPRRLIESPTNSSVDLIMLNSWWMASMQMSFSWTIADDGRRFEKIGFKVFSSFTELRAEIRRFFFGLDHLMNKLQQIRGENHL